MTKVKGAYGNANSELDTSKEKKLPEVQKEPDSTFG
jgi:hypothetical protein